MHINIYFQDDLRKIQFSTSSIVSIASQVENIHLAVYIKTYNRKYRLQNPVELHCHTHYNHNNGQLKKECKFTLKHCKYDE